MNLSYNQTIVPASTKINKVTALAYSPDNSHLAAVASDKIISLFDDNGTRVDKFPTKPADPNQKVYAVRTIAWSPDSTKIAVAQSDSIVFVYKLSPDGKKSICNKFAVSAPVTCMCWTAHQDDILFGLSDGKVRLGHLRNNRSESVYQYGSMVISCSASADRQKIAVAHLDGTLTLVTFLGGTVQKEKIAQHPCPAQALAFAEMLCAAGSDLCVSFYTIPASGSSSSVSTTNIRPQKFDYTAESIGEHEFTCAAASPSGSSVVVSSFNRLRVYSYSLQRARWEEAASIDIPNLYSASALAFRRDGARLAVGTLCGCVEVYSASIRQVKHRGGRFEFTYVSPRQVIARRISDGKTCMVETSRQLEITKVNVHKDNYVVAYTSETLLLADHAHGLCSEIAWQGSGVDKFIFDTPKACMVFNGAELAIVAYGAEKQPLATLRTEYVSVNLTSLRISDAVGDTPALSRIAYLIDPQTIRVEDLIEGTVIATISHERRVDWIELDVSGAKLLFRDRARMLHLFDLVSQQKSTLLDFCSYVQWVPESSVAIAQSRGNACVWYNVSAPERVTLLPVSGDVVDIVRQGGKTEIIVDLGSGQDRIPLNEGLIAFAPSLAAREWDHAVEILEAMTMTPEAEAMWKSLATVALQERKLHVAERCYAALCDVSRARYLRRVSKLAEAAGTVGTDDFAVSAKLDVLEGQFKKAEYTLLNQGKVDEAIRMYHRLQKYDEAIAVAELKNRPEVDDLRKAYLQWLLESGQEERAAALKEHEGDLRAAVELYLRGGLPARAAKILADHPDDSPELSDPALLEQVAGALIKGGLHEKAGELLERLGRAEQALEAYRRGRAYRPSVELARSAFPERVVQLEEEWAEWLVTQRQPESATHHFVEAGKYIRAAEVSVEGRLWTLAVQLVDKLGDTPEAGRYHSLIAQHYEEVLNFDLAEQSYCRGGNKAEAVAMYLRHNMFDKAHAVARTFMDEQEVSLLYINQASRLEGEGRLAEAEQLLTTVGELDVAINMYRQAKRYDDMIRLVSEHRRDLLAETHNAIAEILDNEGRVRDAEPHYLAANRWKSAVNMYRANDMWDDAMRVARQYGGTKAAGQVCTVHAKKVGGEAGVNLLVKHGFSEIAVNFALELGLYLKAEQVAKDGAKSKLPDVYLKHAMSLEDEGHLAEAEEEFLRAGNPREAVLMYTHQQDWLNATRVAESYAPDSVIDILVAQGKVSEEQQKDYQRAEGFYCRAKKPELAVLMYEKAGLHDSAQRVLEAFKLHRTGDGTFAQSDIVPQSIQTKPEDAPSGGNQYDQSIATYLRAADQDPSNVSKAVDIASEFVPARLEEVLQVAESKLAKAGRFAQLAAIYAKLGKVREAIESYVRGSLFNEARELASVRMPDAVRKITQAQLSQRAAEHDWQSCLSIAKDESPELLAKYAAMSAQEFLSYGKLSDACKVFLENGVIPIPENVPVYHKLAQTILGAPFAMEPASNEAAGLLREVLFRAMTDLASTGADFTQQDAEEFEKLTFIVHLFSQFHTCGTKKALAEQRARAAVSLLRYYAAIPADKAYFMAGTACRDVNWPMLFVFLNRFLDISEAMEEAAKDTSRGGSDERLLENGGFENTDIPEELPMPASKQQYLPDDKRDELRSWILQNISTGSAAASIGLATRPCEECGTEIYEASLWCYSCKHQCPSCVITGYPVLRSTRVVCKACGKPANKDDWNKFVLEQKICPWCGDSATPIW